MAKDHVLELPKFIWILKIVQLVLSVLILALAAVNVDAIAYNAHALSVFTAVFSIIILVYYFIAIHASTKLYNWPALLTLESLALIFWLSTWSVLAALYATPSYYYSGYYYWYKRSLSLEKRITVASYQGTFISALTFSVVEFILYGVTLTFVALAAHRHRKAGRPMTYGGGSGPTTAADVEQPAFGNPETTQYHPPARDEGVVQTQPAATQQPYTGA